MNPTPKDSRTAKHIVFERPGEPSQVLSTSNQTVGAPGRNEVLVRMLACPVNPSDLMFIRGIYGIQPEVPATPGFEGVGIVEESGGGLRGTLFRGKRVVVLSRGGGSWSEFAVVPDQQVIPISAKLSVEQAATFFVNPATAWIMTQEVLKVPRGGWLLQTAAGSSLGKMIIRLGQHLGFHTINVVRRAEQADALKKIGADDVIVHDPDQNGSETLADLIQHHIGKHGVSFAIDPVGGLLGSEVIQCLSPGGRMLVFGTLSNQPLTFSPRELMTRSASIEGFWLGKFMNNVSLLFKLRLVRRLTGLIAAGVLATEIDETFGLDQAADAVKAAEESGRAGKVLFRISE